MKSSTKISASLLVLGWLGAPTPADAAGPQPPDQVDVFYYPPSQPNVVLTMDTSNSMSDKLNNQYCAWYQNDPAVKARWNKGNPLTAGKMRQKHHQMRATLIGCMTPDDGVIDRWWDKVRFSARYFSKGSASIAGFNSAKNSIEAAILDRGLKGSTDTSPGLAGSLDDLQAAYDPAASCRPGIVVLLSDGFPSGTKGTFNGGATDGPACGSKISITASGGNAHCGAAYMSGTTDAGCGLGVPITDMMCKDADAHLARVYTIGLSTKQKGSDNLRKIAKGGQGEFHYAKDVKSLDLAFNSIINQTFNLPQIAFQTGTVDVEGPFVYNHTFPAMFKPASSTDTFWVGNLKKYCILPNLQADGKYDGTGTCVFRRNAGDHTQLEFNPAPRDLFTGVAKAEADQGGAGQLLRAKLANKAYPRKLVTWTSGAGYVNVQHTTLSEDLMHMHSIDRMKAINRVHGYQFDVVGDGDIDDVTGDDAGDHKPVGAATWPLGEAMNAKPVMMRYPGKEFLAYAANDGQLHVFDAKTGQEVSAMMPRHVLGPDTSRVANFSLKDAFVPGSDEVRHVFLLDSTPRLFHEDDNANGIIDGGEKAILVVGLGRAGAGYYKFDVSNWNGEFTAATPAYPLVRTPGSTYEDLADTWNPPWLGQMRVAGTLRNVAVFGSGHEREWDEPDALVASAIPGQYYVDTKINEIDCPTLIGTTTTATVGIATCEMNAAKLGAPLGNFDIPGLPPIHVGPVSMPDAVAYRVSFSSFDMDPNDYLSVEDGKGGASEFLTGNKGAFTTKWVYDSSISFQVVPNGIATNNDGFVMDKIQWRTLEREPIRRRSPSVYVVDLDRWNGDAKFDDPTVAQANSGVLLRFTADCKGAPNCIDSGDLQYMRCAISAEPSVLTVRNQVERIYVGDECGQIWRFQESGGKWGADRIFSANDHLGTGWPSGGPFPRSRDVRKFMTRLDLVRTRCTGGNKVGIYFGTGNMQRPNATDDLVAQSDVIGVLFDDGGKASNRNLGDLFNATGVTNVDPKIAPADKGWYVKLSKDERMLRRPIVFAQTAYYKTYMPPSSQTECSLAGGRDAFYVMDSCTSEASNDKNGNGVGEAAERRAQSYDGQIGGPPELLVTRDTTVVVGERGTIVSNPTKGASKVNFRRARMLHWRLTK